jgi:sugar phosphate isomerase/epimerase
MLKDSGLFGPLWWRYRLPGKGQIDWAQVVEALKLYGFTGSFSVHLDDEFVVSQPCDLERSLDAGLACLASLVKG